MKLEPFFKHECHKCGVIDEACFVYSGPHIKQICNECGAYVKFFDKAKIPDVKEIKIKIFSICLSDLHLISEAKKEMGFIENLTGLSAKMMYWKLYLFVRR